MPAREGEELRYPTVEFVLHTVAGWINKHRANGGCDELGRCNPEDAIQIAKDLGVPVGDLQGLTAKRATAANALPKCCRRFLWTHKRQRTAILRSCETCSGRASFVTTKAGAGASLPRVAPLNIFVNSVLTPTRSTRCSNRKVQPPRIDVPILRLITLPVVTNAPA